MWRRTAPLHGTQENDRPRPTATKRERQSRHQRLTMTIWDLDPRVQSYLEGRMGLPLAAFPRASMGVRESPKRTDEHGNRLFIVRIADGALATGIPRIVAAIAPVLRSMTISELFSPLGQAELGRAMEPGGIAPLALGFDYTLAGQRDFRPVKTRHTPVALTRKDIPPEQLQLRMSERRPHVEAKQEDFVWAFACYHDDADATATELAPFGPRCASIAVIIWKAPDLAEFGVGTEEGFRGRGYGLAAVSAATKFVLEQGAVAWYGAYATNVPSLRIARRLGYGLAWQTIWD